MYIESAKIPHEVTRAQKLFYIVLSFLVIAVKITDLSLQVWFKYCWWQFGLITASSITNYTNLENETLIIDVENSACRSLKPLVKYYCPEFCDNIVKIEHAGYCMLIFGIFSMITESICLGFHVWNLYHKESHFDRIWALIVIPKLLFALGFVIWYGLIDPENIKYIEHKHQARPFELFEGFYVACAVLALDFCLMIYGLRWTQRAFTRREKA